LIVVDTLRADHIGAFGYERLTTPKLDAWAASGRLYQRCFATSSWTLPSFVSLLTARTPSRVVDLEAKGLSGLDPATPLLAEILQAQGFATGAVMNNAFLAPQLGWSRGFDSYDWKAGSNLEIRRAEDIVDRSLGWIDANTGGPFFLIVHIFDPHMAYDAPAPHRGRYSGDIETALELPLIQTQKLRFGQISLDDDDRRFIVAAYDEELSYVDDELDRLLAGLAERGVLGNGLVVLTSDHGEELFEHGDFEHGHAMWQELLHVPLVMWGPGIEPGRDHTPVSLSDVMPTILEALELESPALIDGRSIWGTTRGEPTGAVPALFAESLLDSPETKVIIRWPHKLIWHEASGRQELYDLMSDPGERRDLAADEPELREQLASELRAHLASAPGPDPARAPVRLDAGTRERLRTLGYID
jgi:arylsulfatase